MPLTTDTYADLQSAFDYFDEALFGGELPECLITLAHHRSAYGYFRRDCIMREHTEEVPSVDEIALNPFAQRGRDRAAVLSTLVHEMTHLWRARVSSAAQVKTPHDRVWADRMEELGLMPSSTGQEGGKRTGRRVSHWIVPDGPFDRAERDYIGRLEVCGLLPTKPKKERPRKVTYTCPGCELKAKAIEDAHLVCGTCEQTMERPE